MPSLVLLLVMMVALSGFFSAAETSFLSLQRMRLAHMLAERVPGAARVARLLERPTSLLSAILLGANLTNTATAAVATAITTRLLVGDGIAIVISTLASTALLVVFSEVGPKSIALAHAFTLSRFLALPMLVWLRVTRPVTWALDLLTRALLALVGSPVEQGTALTAAELRTAIRMGAQSGALESVASTHLLGALTLQQRQVQEVMVSRVDMVAVDAGDSLHSAAVTLAGSGFLRLPVYEGSPDEVIGYLHVSDLNALQLTGLAGHTIREVMRPVHFESEHASIARVLEVMQEHASYLVMLVDEFGVTSGLITLEDILEEIVGDLRSESGHEAIGEPVTADQPRVVESGMLLVDLSHDLDVDFTEIDANTVAGLVLAYTKRFPRIGESVTHQGYRFTVMEADARRITQVRIERIRDGESAADGAR
ncbi:MAG: HlyC/CorC family transporter [Dehalococcoidia bacterium]|nr:HlyC/CorC family transporter [Dehalococcoidia bacterium]